MSILLEQNVHDIELSFEQPVENPIPSDLNLLDILEQIYQQNAENGEGPVTETPSAPTEPQSAAPPRELASCIKDSPWASGGDLPNLASSEPSDLDMTSLIGYPVHYNAYQPEALRPGENVHGNMSHRRATTLPHDSFSPLLPPPTGYPMHNSTGNTNINLPPVTYDGHYNNPNIQSGLLPSPNNVHAPGFGYNHPPHPILSNNSLPNGYHMSANGLGGSVNSNEYPRGPPVHLYRETPRFPVFSSSPTSPNNHLINGIDPSSAATSSSSLSSIQQTPAALPDTTTGRTKKTTTEVTRKRTSSSSSSARSSGRIKMKDIATDEMPWGLPPEEYKMMNSHDKKQIRNKIGARKFRARRKQDLEDLHAKVEAQKKLIESLLAERHELKVRLGEPVNDTPYAPYSFENSDPSASALGLVMNPTGLTTNGDPSTSNGGQTNILGSSTTTEWGQNQIENSV